jgi:pyruvoyl-dependent arginine decarboxylase (PvlArgDC)
MGSSTIDTGLSAVDLADPYESRRKYSVGQLVAISRQLKRGGWISDKGEYETRSQANGRAEVLAAALARRGVQVQTRTTKLRSNGKFLWAVRERK